MHIFVTTGGSVPAAEVCVEENRPQRERERNTMVNQQILTQGVPTKKIDTATTGRAGVWIRQICVKVLLYNLQHTCLRTLGTLLKL